MIPASEDPATAARLRRDLALGLLPLLMSTIALALAVSMLTAEAGSSVGVSAGLVFVASLIWSGRTVRIAALLRGSQWESVRCEVDQANSGREILELVRVRAGEAASTIYVRSPLGSFGLSLERLGSDPVAAGVPRRVVVIAPSSAGPFFLFHRPDGWFERRPARRAFSAYPTLSDDPPIGERP